MNIAIDGANRTFAECAADPVGTVYFDYFDEGLREWTPDMVKKDLWSAIYDMHKLMRVTENVLTNQLRKPKEAANG